MTKTVNLVITIAYQNECLTIEAAGPRIEIKPEPFDLQPLSDHLRTLALLEEWPPFVTPDELKVLGHALYKTLFVPRIKAAFMQLRGERNDSDVLRICIQTAIPDIAGLPWELVHDEQDFIAMDPAFPIIRSTDKKSVLPTSYVRGPLKILYACASAEDDPYVISLDLDESIKQLRDTLENNKRVRLEIVRHTTPRILESKILEDYHVICFAGHAESDRIYLENGNGGHVEYKAKELAKYLKGRKTRLVFLAACNAARDRLDEETGRRFPSFASTLANEFGIPAVVAMQYWVDDSGTTLLTARYFEALAKLLPVDEALAEARKVVVDHDKVVARDAFSPVLFLQAGSGHLFRPWYNWLAFGFGIAATILLLVLALLAPRYATAAQTAQTEATNRAQAEATAWAEATTRVQAEATAQAESTTRAQAQATAQAESTRRASAEAETGVERDRADQNATIAENQAAKANSRRLSTLASSLEENQVMLAALLSVEAGHAADTAEAFESLNRFAPLLLPQLVRLDHGGQVLGASWSRDESLVLTWGTDGNANLWDAVTGKLYSVLSHSDWVNGAAWNLDDGQILTWSKDGSANVWEANSGMLLLSLHHEASVNGANWNRQETRILTWSDDRTAAVWDAKSGEPIMEFSHENLLYGARWSLDEQNLLTWGEDGAVAIWDTITGERLLTLSHGGPVFGAVWSNDESQVLTSSADGTAIIWDARTGEQLLSLLVGDAVYGADWNADGTKVLTYGRYSPPSIWNASSGDLEYSAPLPVGTSSGAEWNADETLLLAWSGNWMSGYESGAVGIARVGQQASLMELQFPHPVSGASFSGDESRLLIWGPDGTASIWQRQDQTRLFVLTHDSEVEGAKWNAAENRILTWSQDGTGAIWNSTISEHLLPVGVPGLVDGARWSSSGARLLSWSSDSIVLTSSDTNKPLVTIPISSTWGISWSPDEDLVAQLGNDEPTIIWDLDSGKPVATLDTRGQRVERAQWNDTNALLLTESQSRTTVDWSVDLWNIITSERLIHVDDTRPSPSAEWSPGAQQFLSLVGNEVIIWDIANDTPAKRLGHAMEVQGAIWKSDDQVLSWTEAGTVMLWDLQTGTSTLSLQTGSKPGSPLNGVTFNADQSQFMTWGSSGEVEVWSISGNRLVSMMTHAPVGSAAWNTDESRIFTLGNSVLTVWDAASGERHFGVTQDGGMSGAAWNTLGTQILTWGGTEQGGAATVWSGLSGERVRALDTNRRGVLSAAWNSDETQIMITLAGGDVWRYYAQIDDLIEATCHRVTRNLNWDEWRQYFPGEPYRCSCPKLPLHPSVLASTDAVISDGTVCAEN